MAAFRFYRFVKPSAKRSWSDGSPIKVTDIGNEIGLYATDNPKKIEELDLMIAEQRGGAYAISYEEFEKLKKNRTSPSIWREEISRRGLEVNRQPARAQEVLSSMRGSVNSAVGRAAVETDELAPLVPESRPTATKRE